MKVINIQMSIECNEDDRFEIEKAFMNHIDWLIDLESWPEIKSIFGVRVVEEEERK